MKLSAVLNFFQVSLAVPTAHFPSHEVVAFRMCIESIRQKKRYLFLDQGPVFMEDVVHL